MGRWTTFVDKCEAGKKIYFEINGLERENLEAFKDCGAKLWSISSDFASNNSLD